MEGAEFDRCVKRPAARIPYTRFIQPTTPFHVGCVEARADEHVVLVWLHETSIPSTHNVPLIHVVSGRAIYAGMIQAISMPHLLAYNRCLQNVRVAHYTPTASKQIGAL